MKDFGTTAAGKLMAKTVADAQARQFFNPNFEEIYTLQPATKKVKVGDKTYERLVLLATSTGVEHLVDPRSMTQVAMDDDLKIIESQSPQEVEKILAESDSFKFEVVADCLLFGKQVKEGVTVPADAIVYTANSGNKFIMRKGKQFKIVAA